jgi:hypothetical protein
MGGVWVIVVSHCSRSPPGTGRLCASRHQRKKKQHSCSHETGGNSGIILDSDQPLLGADQAGLREQVCRCAGGGIQFSLSNATWRVIHYALATTGSSGST